MNDKILKAIEDIRALNTMFHFSNENIAILEVELHRLRSVLGKFIKVWDELDTQHETQALREYYNLVIDTLVDSDEPVKQGIQTEEIPVQESSKCICKYASIVGMSTLPLSIGRLKIDPNCPEHGKKCTCAPMQSGTYGEYAGHKMGWVSISTPDANCPIHGGTIFRNGYQHES